MRDVVVIIVGFNTRDLVIKSIESVLTWGQGLDCEIIVVDNASVDGSPEAIRDCFPQVRLLCNPENKGFAVANNQAIRASQSRYVALLNPDAALLNDALIRMKDYLDAHPEVGVVGPRMQDGGGRPLATAHGFESLATVLVATCGLHRALPDCIRRPASRLLGGKGKTYQANFDANTPVVVDWISGACMMVRREDIEAVGALDEDYFMYMEDEEWCLRMGKAGRQTVYLPDALVLHAVSYAPPGEAKVRLLYESSLVYHRKANPVTYPLIHALLRARYLSDLRKARHRTAAREMA